MKKRILIIVPYRSLAYSLKRIIQYLIPSVDVEIYPPSSEGKVNTLELVKNLDKIKKCELIIMDIKKIFPPRNQYDRNLCFVSRSGASLSTQGKSCSKCK